MTQENPVPPEAETPDTAAVQAAFETLQRAFENQTADKAELQAAFDQLKKLYDKQTHNYTWAENQRKEFWRLYNYLRDLLGVPKQNGSTPYTLEQFKEQLAKLPPVGADVERLTRERDDALAKAASFQDTATRMAQKAEAAESRAVKAEGDLAKKKEEEGFAVALQKRLKEAMAKKGIPVS